MARSDLSDIRHYDGPCLLSLVQPIRHYLHPFLSDADAARLMQASRFTTSDLLEGYGFFDYVFNAHTGAEMKRTVALYNRYHMRIVRMSLTKEWNEPLVDSESGRSVLPASLVALTLGEVSLPSADQPIPRYAATAALSGSEGGVAEEGNEVAEAGSEEGDEREFYRRIEPVDTTASLDLSWTVSRYDSVYGEFNQPIPPGALPYGLRFLQFGWSFFQPLQVGSIPETVEVLQFGTQFDQPLSAGHLPASLTHLVFGICSIEPLQPGVLPTGLRRLRMATGHNQPLQLGTLPPQLQQLAIDHDFD